VSTMDKATSSWLHHNELEEAILDNRHIAQVTQYAPMVRWASKDSLTRILKPDARERPYRRRNRDKKTVIHWGQRKLLMSEIEFLTLYAEPGDTVVYAGAAPGNHTYFLSLMFPFLKFVLVDPSPFYCISTPRIDVRQEFFSDQTCEEFQELGKQGKILFISDIRTACWQVMSDVEVENAVAWDMEAQQRWHLLIFSKRSMLKFRLPWKPGCTDYLDGDVHLPVWGPSTTTEARLITGSREKRPWNNSQYEAQMFYFNTSTRTQLFHHDIDAPGLDHCFDCTSEVIIWEGYLKRYSRIWKNAVGKMKKIFQVRKDNRGAFQEELEEEDEDIPSKQNSGSLSSTPSEAEKQLMESCEDWEIDWKEYLSDDLSVQEMTNLIKEAVNLANPICSNGRTLTSKLAPVEKRKWFIPRRFVGNQVINVTDSSQLRHETSGTGDEMRRNKRTRVDEFPHHEKRSRHDQI